IVVELIDWRVAAGTKAGGNRVGEQIRGNQRNAAGERAHAEEIHRRLLMPGDELIYQMGRERPGGTARPAPANATLGSGRLSWESWIGVVQGVPGQRGEPRMTIPNAVCRLEVEVDLRRNLVVLCRSGAVEAEAS